jgi:hypothetical protein
MDHDQELRTQLTALLTLRQAHMDFEDAVADFPPEHINTRPPNCAYTFWHLLEHLRICQRDILDYIRADDYEWLTFPDDLWPDPAVDQFLADRRTLVEIIDSSILNFQSP